MNKKKTIGGSLIMFGGVFLNVYAVFFIYKAIKNFSGSAQLLQSNGGSILQGINIVLALLIFIIATFGMRHKDNVDAGKAIFNRGIFLLVVGIPIMIANSIFSGFNLHYIILPLDALLYGVGGYFNNFQAQKEIELSFNRENSKDL